MSPMPFTISVVVPAYNAERYVNEPIDSLMAPTEALHQIIIVNNGSTDDTAQRLTKYANNDSLDVVHAEN